MQSRIPKPVQTIADRLGLARDWYLIVVAMGIGLLMGGIATAFILPLRWIEEWADGANADLLRWLVPVAPIVGAILAGYVIWALKGVGRGPGVSAVIYGIHRNRSELPLRTGIRKWISSTLTIGSGGSAGAEGPIVTIGSVIGSNIGRWLGATPQKRATLLGCGAAAGIAAVFNAPIAGIFFVLEILLRDFSLKTFPPIVIAAVVASAWSRGILGDDPLFPVVEAGSQFTIMQLPNFLLLGGVCGVAAALFVRGLDVAERQFARVPVHPILKPALGATVLGILGLIWMNTVPNDGAHTMPPFYGNGYPIIKNLLDPAQYVDAARNLRPVSVLAILCGLAILKSIATCLTIGSGGAGGMFAPSLLIGAAVGGAFGWIVNALEWFPAADPASYALVGMGAMVAATTHAPLTGIMIVYEVTQSYETILPLMMAAVIATITGRLVHRESVYTSKLTRMGMRFGGLSDLTVLRRLSVSDVPLQPPVTVREDDSAQRLLEISEHTTVNDFIVVNDKDEYRGLVTSEDLKAALVYREAIPLLQVNELQRTDVPTASPNDQLDVVLEKFAAHDVHSLAVLEPSSGRVRGLITRSRLMARYQSVLHED